MNKDLEQYVRNRLTSENEDALIKEFANTVARVKKEREMPKTPVKDALLSISAVHAAANNIFSDSVGTIDKKALIQLIAIYLCQHGAEPDDFTEDYQQLANHIENELGDLQEYLNYLASRAKQGRPVDPDIDKRVLASMGSIFDTFFGPAYSSTKS